MDPTDRFPLLYHAHHNRHLEDLPFWLELTARQGGPILELGCGTGRVLLPLAESGLRVIGLDNDARMLAFLQTRLPPSLRRKVSLLRADITRIPLAGRFELVVLPCNTFSTLQPRERLRCLTCVRSLLAPGGVFALSMANPEMLRRLPRRSDAEFEEAFPHPLDGEPVQVSSAWERSAKGFKLTWHYDHLLPDGKVERLSVRVNHYLTSVEEILAGFRASGLEVVETYGDFDGSAFSPEAESLILLARPGGY